jgi:hypothetical protein
MPLCAVFEKAGQGRNPDCERQQPTAGFPLLPGLLKVGQDNDMVGRSEPGRLE